MLSSIKLANVRKARPGSNVTKYANFDLEDIDGNIRCILWPEDFANHGHLVQADAILAVRGRIDRRGGGDEANLIVNELIPLSELASKFTRGVVIRIDEATHGQEILPQLREVLRAYPGRCEVRLLLCLADGSRVYLNSERPRVDVTPELRGRLDNLLGERNHKLLTTSRGGGRR